MEDVAKAVLKSGLHVPGKEAEAFPGASRGRGG